MKNIVLYVRTKFGRGSETPKSCSAGKAQDGESALIPSFTVVSLAG